MITNTISLLKSRRINLETTPKGLAMEKVVLLKRLNNEMFDIKESQCLYCRLNNISEEMLLLTYPLSTLQWKTEGAFYVEGYETATLEIPEKHINHAVVVNASLIKGSNIRIKKI